MDAWAGSIKLMNDAVASIVAAFKRRNTVIFYYLVFVGS
jgi:hypothetical protein